MHLNSDKNVLYKGPSGPPSIPGVYELIAYKFYRHEDNWGMAKIIGVAAESAGGGSLTFPSLVGITIDSCSTTTVLPTIVGNTVTFPVGVFWDLRLSDGSYVPDILSGYNVTAFGSHGVPGGFTINYSSGGSLYCLTYGYNRTTEMIPASITSPGIDVLGNPTQYLGGINRHNLADSIIDYTGLTNPVFNKNAYVGNPYLLPEVWLTNTWDIDTGNPFQWGPYERTMSYLTSRITPVYKNTIMIKENVAVSTLVGISREEVFSTPLLDSDYNTLNFIYNGIAIPN